MLHFTYNKPHQAGTAPQTSTGGCGGWVGVVPWVANRPTACAFRLQIKRTKGITFGWISWLWSRGAATGMGVKSLQERDLVGLLHPFPESRASLFLLHLLVEIMGVWLPRRRFSAVNEVKCLYGSKGGMENWSFWGSSRFPQKVQYKSADYEIQHHRFTFQD